MNTILFRDKRYILFSINDTRSGGLRDYFDMVNTLDELELSIIEEFKRDEYSQEIHILDTKTMNGYILPRPSLMDDKQVASGIKYLMSIV